MTFDDLRRSLSWRAGSAAAVLVGVLWIMSASGVAWPWSLGLGSLIYAGFVGLHWYADHPATILAVYAFVTAAGYGMTSNYSNYSCTGLYWPIGLLWGGLAAGFAHGIGVILFRPSVGAPTETDRQQ